MRIEQVFGTVGLAALMCGCHLFGGLKSDCHKPQDYQHAGQVPPLIVPPGLDSPNTKGALVIPTVENTAPSPGPKDPCLESPPRYKPAPATKAASS